MQIKNLRKTNQRDLLQSKRNKFLFFKHTENYVSDYNLGFLIIMSYIGYFGVTSILQNAENSVNNLLIIDAV